MEGKYLIEDTIRALSNSLLASNQEELDAQMDMLKENFDTVWVMQQEAVFEAIHKVRRRMVKYQKQKDLANAPHNDMGWYTVDLMEGEEMGENDDERQDFKNVWNVQEKCINQKRRSQVMPETTTMSPAGIRTVETIYASTIIRYARSLTPS